MQCADRTQWSGLKVMTSSAEHVTGSDHWLKAACSIVYTTCCMALQMFGADEAALGASDTAASRRKQLVFELNRSGQYLHIKEQLKASVLRIVKEHYHKSGSMAREEMQAWHLPLCITSCPAIEVVNCS